MKFKTRTVFTPSIENLHKFIYSQFKKLPFKSIHSSVCAQQLLWPLKFIVDHSCIEFPVYFVDPFYINSNGVVIWWNEYSIAIQSIGQGIKLCTLFNDSFVKSTDRNVVIVLGSWAKRTARWEEDEHLVNPLHEIFNVRKIVSGVQHQADIDRRALEDLTPVSERFVIPSEPELCTKIYYQSDSKLQIIKWIHLRVSHVSRESGPEAYWLSCSA
jgi:hypothetical protein